MSHKLILLVLNIFKNLELIFLHRPEIGSEHGLQDKVQSEIKRVLFLTYEFKVKIFKSKKEYIDEFSEIQELDFDYIKDSFRWFLISNLVSILLFALYNFVIKILKVLNFLKNFLKI